MAQFLRFRKVNHRLGQIGVGPRATGNQPSHPGKDPVKVESVQLTDQWPVRARKLQNGQAASRKQDSEHLFQPQPVTASSGRHGSRLRHFRDGAGLPAGLRPDRVAEGRHELRAGHRCRPAPKPGPCGRRARRSRPAHRALVVETGFQIVTVAGGGPPKVLQPIVSRAVQRRPVNPPERVRPRKACRSRKLRG